MEYLKNKAILICDKGLVPSLLEVTSNTTVFIQKGLSATVKDNLGGINIKSFGLCSIKGKCQADLELSGKPLQWINSIPNVKVCGNKTLTEKSKLLCPFGGIISSLQSGQI